MIHFFGVSKNKSQIKNKLVIIGRKLVIIIWSKTTRLQLYIYQT